MSKSKHKHPQAASGQAKKTAPPAQSHPKKPAAAHSHAKKAAPKFPLYWALVGIAVLALGGLGIFMLTQNRSAAPAASANEVSSALPAVISVADAHQKYNDGAFVLDVREPSEWDSFHAPNTTLIPLGELASRVDELPKDQPIVVVCRSGNRSQEGRDILLAAGFTQVTSMDGGLNDWKAAGYPTVSGP